MGAPSRDEILGRLRERIVAFAASRMGRDAAEDLAQETLILLEEKYAHVERIEELLPLSLRIVLFKMTALRRKAARRGEYSSVSVTDVQLPDLDAGPDVLVERKQTLERLARAVAQLGPRCRQLLRLKLAGRGFAEIQKEMGAAALNTVYTWDHRCRKRLLELMGGEWEGKR
jgi:RNA polymerase sigma-70 factor, ECF subfamily